MTDTLTGRDKLSSQILYNHETGCLLWRRPKPGIKGRRAGCRNKSTGYREVTVLGRQYKEHRLAWFLEYNEWPAGMIDHINGDKTDNRIVNLRVVNARGNAQNRHDVETGHLPGTTKSGNNWKAQITIAGRHIHLGSFWTREEAHEAYVKACKEYGV